MAVSGAASRTAASRGPLGSGGCAGPILSRGSGERVAPAPLSSAFGRAAWLGGGAPSRSAVQCDKRVAPYGTASRFVAFVLGRGAWCHSVKEPAVFPGVGGI